MRVSYYPGCSLLGTAREYDDSIRVVGRMLGIELDEIDNWNCCGAISGHSTNPSLAVALPIRNLIIAEKKGGQQLVIPCPACYQRLKVAEKGLLKAPSEIKDFSPIKSGDFDRDPSKKQLGLEPKYEGKVRIRSLLDFLSEDYNLKVIQEKLERALVGLKPVCYYGCLSVRPPEITGVENYEDPQTMDELMIKLGAESLSWSYKTDCCGANLNLTHPDIAINLVDRLIAMAREAGANCVAVCCPLCQANLDTRQHKESQLPVFYFTELIGLALGYTDTSKWWERHLVEPRGLLLYLGLI